MPCPGPWPLPEGWGVLERRAGIPGSSQLVTLAKSLSLSVPHRGYSRSIHGTLNSPLKGNPESLKASEFKPQLCICVMCTFLFEVTVPIKP